jgi:hypothetical protein
MHECGTHMFVSFMVHNLKLSKFELIHLRSCPPLCILQGNHASPKTYNYRHRSDWRQHSCTPISRRGIRKPTPRTRASRDVRRYSIVKRQYMKERREPTLSRKASSNPRKIHSYGHTGERSGSCVHPGVADYECRGDGNSRIELCRVGH